MENDRSNRDLDRPDHPARGLPEAARGRPRQLPARVGRARAARAPLVRRLRLASSWTSRGAEQSGKPVVGYLGYDHAATLEPTVQLPGDGPSLPESRFVVAETLIRFDHVLGLAEVLAGNPEDVAELLRAQVDDPVAAANGAKGGPTRRFPGRFEYEQRVEQAKRHIRAGRRVPDRPLPARRAADTRERARPLPIAPACQPLPVPLPARARRHRPGRLLARDARQGRGRHRRAEPDRRHDAPRRRRRGAPARLREGPRGARDARRPRPERPLARLQAGHGARAALPRGGALLARHAPRVGGRPAS